MEKAPLGTLRDHLPLKSWNAFYDVIAQILDALAFSHARGIIHLDIKPENILLFRDDKTGRVSLKLGDFGIAHAVSRELKAETDELESIPGTPAYISPEQLKANWRRYDAHTDLYALGCVAYELLCGTPPFTAGSTPVLTHKHLNADRPKVRPSFTYPEGIAPWVHRMMAIEPDNRFDCAADAAAALPGPYDNKEPGFVIDHESHQSDDSHFTHTLNDRTRRTATLPGDAMASTLLLDEHPSVDSSNEGESVEADAPEGHLDFPESWRGNEFEQPPAPMIGAGFGLVGLRDIPFVDRDEARSRLWSILREVWRERSLRGVFIEGIAGTGKSRLARWLGIRAEELGVADFLEAIHSPAGSGPADGLGGLVKRYFRLWKADRGEAYAYIRDELRELEHAIGDKKELAKALTEIAYPTYRDAEEVKGPRYNFKDPAHRYAMLTAFLRHIGSSRVPILLLDDLQWRRSSQEFLSFLTEQPEARHPTLLIVGTVRTDIVGGDESLHKRFETLKQSNATESIGLDELQQSDHRQLLEQVLPLDADLAESLTERTEGNPLFAIQLMEDWIDRGAVELDEDGFVVTDNEDIKLPTGIRQLWRRRLKRLVELYPSQVRNDIRRSLELAATLGRDIDQREWEATCKEADLMLPSDLPRRLGKHGLIEEADGGWSFVHGLLVESLETMAQEDRRYEQNQKICARMLRKLYPSTEDPQIEERKANHWIEGGEPEEALEFLLRATKIWRRKGESENGRQSWEKWCQIVDNLGLSMSKPSILEGHLLEIHVLIRDGKVEGATQLAEQVLDEARQLQSSELQAKALRQLGKIANFDCEYAEAVQYLQQGLDLARRHNHNEVVLTTALDLSNARIALKQFRKGEQKARLARRIARKNDKEFFELLAQNNLAWTLLRDREHREAETMFEELLGRSREGHYPVLMQRAAYGLANLREKQREYAEAKTLIDWARRQQAVFDVLDAPIRYHLASAQLFVQQSKFDKAEKHLAEVEKPLMESKIKDNLRASHSLLKCWLEAGRGEWEAFEGHLESVENLLDKDSDVIPNHPFVLERFAEFAIESDKLDHAMEALDLANDLWVCVDDGKKAEEVQVKLDALS